VHTPSRKNKSYPLQILALATFVVFIFFAWQGDKGFDLADEGFLWYGVQRVTLGDVPIRDFMAYDPGRYYWSAAFMRLWGDNGLMPLRVSMVIFEIIGLFVGLLLIAHNSKKQNILFLLLSAFTLLAWMFVYYKVSDISLSILLVGVLALLIDKPTSQRYFFAGLCLGLVAVFGRNHGVYGLVGSIGVMVWLRIRQDFGPGFIKGFALWAAGIMVGFTPIFFMALFIPGFAVAFWKSILFLFEVKTTNLPLPIPRPWWVDFASLPMGEAIRQVLYSLFFFALVVLPVLLIIWTVRQKFQTKQNSAELVAASFLALPYAHYAYSRADITHLALAIFPLLIGCLVLLARQPGKVKWPLAVILLTSSLWVTHSSHPGWQCLNNGCVNITISGNDILVSPTIANDVELLSELVQQYAPDGQPFIMTPFLPSAYSIFERRSPMWEIYALFPQSRESEQAEIERIKIAKPVFALIFDLALDGRDELRFKNTHPLTHQFILDHFERLPDTSNPAYQIYKARG
jgi:hypothetical protein